MSLLFVTSTAAEIHAGKPATGTGRSQRVGATRWPTPAESARARMRLRKAYERSGVPGAAPARPWTLRASRWPTHAEKVRGRSFLRRLYETRKAAKPEGRERSVEESREILRRMWRTPGSTAPDPR